MAEITASMVKELREKTDAPMMECKKALAEAEGDMVKAEEILRVKLGNKAGKAASRIAAEGIATTYISADGKSGALIEVNCETDFVAKNDDFIAFTKALAQLVVEKNPANVEALSALPLNGSTVDEVRKGLIGKIGENMSIRRFARMQTANRLASYTHGARIGVLVDYAAADEQVGKDVAMHIAASKPVCVSKDQVPAEKIEVERNIYTQQAAESGKPADIVAKMVEGRITKFLAEITLLSQPFVKNPDETVEKMLKAKNASVAGFALFVVGEGIEKKQDDFASEVAKIAAGMQ
ncbi:MAG: elongation factor Ts [Burkholderiales bacterium]|jgi:elongation factor Ts|nr:elongation factor Ts [Burkholderiales bacterium]MCA3154323.1 elongation factor Ts [Burkholderiales bacterium]MCA3156250.1 elongation factor Ts [Burkholderiales bacterium]MCA3158760.1 elongation factor Ts [Burkholderiales bacterium]MCA3160930.1 elongation factor Ts [Burkholderiales bacterium]